MKTNYSLGRRRDLRLREQCVDVALHAFDDGDDDDKVDFGVRARKSKKPQVKSHPTPSKSTPRQTREMLRRRRTIASLASCKMTLFMTTRWFNAVTQGSTRSVRASEVFLCVFLETAGVSGPHPLRLALASFLVFCVV